MTPSLSKLRQQMLEHMDDGDLRLVVFSLSEKRNDLALRYENLGDTFNNRVLQLILYCRTHRCVADLVAALKETCPVVLAPPEPDPAWDAWAQGRDTAPAAGDDDLTPIIKPPPRPTIALLIGGIVLLIAAAVGAYFLLNANKPSLGPVSLNPSPAGLSASATPLLTVMQLLPTSTPVPLTTNPTLPSSTLSLAAANTLSPTAAPLPPSASPVVIVKYLTVPAATAAPPTSLPNAPTSAPARPSATLVPPTNPSLPPSATPLPATNTLGPPSATPLPPQPTCPPTPTGATIGTGIADFIYSHPDVVSNLGCLQSGETGAAASYLEMEKGYVICELGIYKRIYVFSYVDSTPTTQKFDIYPNECPAVTPTPTPLPNDEPTPPAGLYMPTGTIGNFWINHNLRDTLGYAKTPDRDDTAIAHVSFTNGRIVWAHTNSIYCYVLYGPPNTVVGRWERYPCSG